MTWYLLTYLTFSCPGGAVARFLWTDTPDAIKSLICTVTVEKEIYTHRERAYKETRKLACGSSRPQLSWCKNLKCSDKKITCTTNIEIQGDQ